MRTREPQFAIAIPHPEQQHHCAVNARTGTLPAWRQPDEGLGIQRENLALHLASLVTGSKKHSVNIYRGTLVQQALYIMKPSEDEVLKPGYEWLDSSVDAWRNLYKAAESEQRERVRDALQERAMQALALHTLMDSIGTDRESDVVLSYFCENPGMYRLEKIPVLSQV